MLPRLRQLPALFALLSVLSFTSSPLQAWQQGDDHVVPLSQLRGDVNYVASQRTKNLADIGQVLSMPAVQEQLGKANLKGDQVQAAVARLDDKELARLADRARAVDQDVRAGVDGVVWFLAGLVVFVVLIVVLTQTL